MEKALITLPITPIANPPLGLIASILVGDFAARNLGLKFVLALGPQMLLKPTNRQQIIDAFLDHLKDAGVRPDYIWRIDSENVQAMIQELAEKLITKGLLTTGNTALIDVCPCGTVEKLSDAVGWYEKRRLYTISSDGLRCKLCHGLTQQVMKPICRFCFGEPILIDPQPSFYSTELATQIELFAKTQLMVSRLRDTSIKFKVGSEEINLDPDFAWQMYLATLPSLGIEPEIVLGSNHNLRAIVLIAALQQALTSVKTLQTLIPPYFLGEGGKRLGPEHTMETLSRSHRKNSIRALIGLSLNWKQKESIIQTSQLPLLDKMSERLQRILGQGEPVKTIVDFLARCEYQRIRNTLGSVRRDKGVPDPSPLFGIID